MPKMTHSLNIVTDQCFFQNNDTVFSNLKLIYSTLSSKTLLLYL